MTKLLSNYKLWCSQKNKYLSILVVPRTLLCFNYKSGQCRKEIEHSSNRPKIPVPLQKLSWLCTSFVKISCKCNQSILEVASPSPPPPRGPCPTQKRSMHTCLLPQRKRTWKAQICRIPLPSMSHEEELQVPAARRSPRVREVLQTLGRLLQLLGK